MNPLMGFALAHPEEPPLPHLERISLQVDQDKQQPILGRGQGTVRVGRVPTGGARSSIEAPFRHMGLERGLIGWDYLLKLGHRETGHIEQLCGASLEIGKP
jgi:hypothetical protein